MKKRPWEIIVISVLYLLAPLGNLLQAWFINQTNIAELMKQFKPMDWIILISYPIIAVCVFTVKKWGWYLFIAFSFILIIFNVFGYLRNQNYSLTMLIIFNVIIIGVTALLFRKHVLSPYFNPRVRWWEVADRFKLELTATLHTDQHIIESQILDISKSGCFVSTDTPIDIGTQVWIEMKFSGKEVDCFGKIVRSASKNEDRNGYGILFLSIGSESKKILNGLLLTMKDMGITDRTFDEKLNENLKTVIK